MSEVEKFLAHKAYNLRKWSIIQTTHAGSGHPTSCLSAADIVSVLFFYAMHYDPLNYNNPDNDRFILSKGHAAPVLYAAWHEVGVITQDDLLTYRQLHSVLEGHPSRRFAYIEAATGSLGIGLSIGVGELLAARLDQRNYKMYVLMGDSETSEGSVWESVQIAAHYKLNNLVAIIDANRLGQSTETLFGHHIQQYTHVLNGFGWHTISVDGHDIQQLMNSFDEARSVKDKPVMIVAKTLKGYGIDLVQDKENFHGKPFSQENLETVLSQLKARFAYAAAYTSSTDWHPTPPQKSLHDASNEKTILSTDQIPTVITLPEPTYTQEKPIATRHAYGEAIAALGTVFENMVSLDAEVKNSTYACLFEDAYPERFFQCFIAEQNMLGMAIGFDRREKIPFVSTFGAFFSRAHDQIRMGAIGKAALRLVGSHCGVSIGQDGPSQMALEDIALMCALPQSIVLYPSDAVSTYKLVELMAQYTHGISYLRTTRAQTPVIYKNNEKFEIGGCKVLRQSGHDSVCLIAAGITLVEALKAYDMLIINENPIHVSVIDLYSIKPFDRETVVKVATASHNAIITIEDHYKQGGIGQIVAAALCNTPIVVESLAVDQVLCSGKPEELMHMVGIDADSIIKKVHDLIKRL